MSQLASARCWPMTFWGQPTVTLCPKASLLLLLGNILSIPTVAITINHQACWAAIRNSSLPVPLLQPPCFAASLRTAASNCRSRFSAAASAAALPCSCCCVLAWCCCAAASSRRRVCSCCSMAGWACCCRSASSSCRVAANCFSSCCTRSTCHTQEVDSRLRAAMPTESPIANHVRSTHHHPDHERPRRGRAATK